MKKLLFFVFVLIIHTGLYGQSTVNTSAQAKEVTIFTNGAEIVNTIQARLPKGSSNLIVQNVANDIDERSIQLSGSDGVTVLSIARATASSTAVLSAAHKQLKDSLDALSAQRELTTNRKSAAEGALKILNNENLLTGDGKVDFVALSKLVDYYQEKSVQLKTEISRLNKEVAELDRRIAEFNTKIRSYVGGGGQIVIQLVSTREGIAPMTLTYRTNSANWHPYYDVRASSISHPLSFSYKARITQFTGVDWRNVKLTLSTGNPSQSGDAPILQPNYVVFQSHDQMSVANMIQGKVQGVQIGTRARMAEQEAASPIAEYAPGPSTTISESQLSAVFEIDVPYDILSNGQPHSVTLNSFEHPALFKYYTVPKADKDAFLLAEINNYQTLNLMPGEANIFFENMYVGKSYINTQITTDTLNLSMGRDKAINIKRERIMDQRSTQVSGNTKRQNYTYEIRIRNNKSTAVNMLLKDQYPISTDREIIVELQDAGGANVDRETGILTWMITVKPGETKTYRFSYQIRHPKNREISF